jgi:uncharacterized Zn finger protein (UPF0148 family)
MHCRSCGSELKFDDIFCRECGEKNVPISDSKINITTNEVQLKESQLIDIEKSNSVNKISRSKTSHRRKLILNLTFNKAFALCLESVDSLNKSKLIEKNKGAGHITAKCGFTLKTWGDKIEFKIKIIDEDRTEVEFSSKPIMPLTVFDYGKNLQNIKTLENVLKPYRQE